MYTKPEFAPQSREKIFDLIRATTFATIVSTGREGLVASHLTFLVDPHRGEHGTLRSHLARANPHSLTKASDTNSLARTSAHSVSTKRITSLPYFRRPGPHCRMAS